MKGLRTLAGTLEGTLEAVAHPSSEDICEYGERHNHAQSQGSGQR